MVVLLFEAAPTLSNKSNLQMTKSNIKVVCERLVDEIVKELLLNRFDVVSASSTDGGPPRGLIRMHSILGHN